MCSATGPMRDSEIRVLASGMPIRILSLVYDSGPDREGASANMSDDPCHYLTQFSREKPMLESGQTAAGVAIEPPAEIGTTSPHPLRPETSTRRADGHHRMTPV